jgi:hypothetical protein
LKEAGSWGEHLTYRGMTRVIKDCSSETIDMESGKNITVLRGKINELKILNLMKSSFKNQRKDYLKCKLKKFVTSMLVLKK